MLTILEVLQKTEAFFQRAGLERPKVESEWLLAQYLGLKRLDLFLQHERPLQTEQVEGLRAWVKRRAAGEPLQYIVGHVDFHGIELAVAPGVLIPRPETEQLVAYLVEHGRELADPRIIDLGTGSGAIALALAAALPKARVLGIDRSPAAVQQAQANADRLSLRDRVAFRRGSWLEDVQATADIIVANPPYLTETEWSSARPEVREHEPREALVADEAGLADLRTILRTARGHLAEGGLLAMEMGIAHGSALHDLAQEWGYREISVRDDDASRPRFLFARWPGTSNSIS